MTKNKSLLEKALNRFERTNPKKIEVKRNPYPNPNWYIIKACGTKLVLIHNIDHTYTDGADERRLAERYELDINNLDPYRKEAIASFQEDYKNFGRIKTTYELITKQIMEYQNDKEEKNKRKDENGKKRKLRRLERFL
jgi:hypothetical protein